ncbi:MAG: methionine aminotransferase [Kangiellaceae bacterium]
MLNNKLENVGTSIFTEMTLLAKKTNAINLSQGFPEFETPEFLKQAVVDAISLGKNQYPPSAGLPELLDEIASLVKTQYNKVIVGSENVTITSGATEALFVALQLVVSEGDEVIIFDPAYDAYEPVVELAGGKCVHIGLDAPEYKVDWQLVEKNINSKTKAIVINSPHNPTGTLLNRADMLALEKIVLKHELFLISDEVYDFITFDNEQHESVLRYPKLFERAFIVSSFGKTFHCTGWKMGYCVAPKEFTKEFRKLHQFVTFTTSTPNQYGLIEMLRQHPQHINELSAFYQQKRDYLVNALEDSKFKILPAKGTYFLLADYSDISDMKDKDFCYWLAEEVGVAAVPLSPFYPDGYNDKVIRLCFAKYEKTLDEASEKLCGL